MDDQNNKIENNSTSSFSDDNQNYSHQKLFWIGGIIILVILAIVGGFFYFLSSKKVAQNQTNQNQNIRKTNNQKNSQGVKNQNQVKTSEPSSAAKTMDCGNTQYNLLNQALNPENNSTLVCLGNHFLNNCQEAKAVINGDGIIIKGGSLTECKIRIGTGKELAVNINEVKKLAQKDNKKPEDYPGTMAGTILVMKAFESINPQDLPMNKIGSADNRVKYTKLLDKGFVSYVKSNIGFSLDGGLKELERCQREDVYGQHDLYRLSDDCHLLFVNSKRNKSFYINIEKVNYQLAYKNNFDLDKAISEAKKEFGYSNNMNSAHRAVSDETLPFQNIDEYKIYGVFAGDKDILIRKGSWVIEVSYPQEIEDQKIVNIVNYLTSRM